MAYEKDPFFAIHRKEILRLAGNKKALENYPTKTNPRLNSLVIHAGFPRKPFQISQITIDQTKSFERVRKLKSSPRPRPIPEIPFKNGIKSILGEYGQFQDWGGEPNDLFSTRLTIRAKRLAAAFGFKGKGTPEPLNPKKMGKRGDQIQRLFRSPADVFFVQFWGQIDETILEQMHHFAITKSVQEGKMIYYGIIDGVDTQRILAAYPKHFPPSQSST